MKVQYYCRLAKIKRTYPYVLTQCSVSQTQKQSTTRKSRSTTGCAATQSTGSPKTQKGSTTRKSRNTTCVRQHRVQEARKRRKGVQHESHEVPLFACGLTDYRAILWEIKYFNLISLEKKDDFKTENAEREYNTKATMYNHCVRQHKSTRKPENAER